VAVTDLNGDGHLDIITSGVTVLLGNGDGTFSSPTSYAVPGGGALIVGDFNRDGQPDVAVTSSYPAGTLTTLLTPVSTNLVLNAPITATAGKAFSITVSAVDASGNALPGYTGTVHFSLTGTDPYAKLPADYTFTASDHGVHTFTGVSLGQEGFQGYRTIDVHDTTTADIAGSYTVQVAPAAATHFQVSAPASTTAGTAFTITVTALDRFGNVATGYLGTVTFSSSDTSAVLPASYTFSSADNGTHSFSVPLNTAGSQSITVADAVHTGDKGKATVLVNAHNNRNSRSADSGVSLDPAAVDALFAADAI
jgi:hypothetical protein